MALELLTPFTKVELEEKKRDTNRKQIGIMGGNFNPVHNAHLVVADQVRQQLCLDHYMSHLNNTQLIITIASSQYLVSKSTHLAVQWLFSYQY
ncbi:conserved hypothetical protein [Streptococcus agalactiae 515]|nr:conserved hypothetical protein [Streptococcus agalactiae 515]